MELLLDSLAKMAEPRSNLVAKVAVDLDLLVLELVLDDFATNQIEVVYRLIVIE